MAEQAMVQFRVDKQLKNDVTEIYESLGMDLPTALRIFMTRSKLAGGVPFDVRIPKESAQERRRGASRKASHTNA